MREREHARFLGELHALRRLQHDVAVEAAVVAANHVTRVVAARDDAIAALDEAVTRWTDDLADGAFDPDRVAARVLEVGERDDACRAATERYGAAVGLVDALNEARFSADARRDQAERLARRARRALARHRDASAEAEVADRLSHLWTRS